MIPGKKQTKSEGTTGKVITFKPKEDVANYIDAMTESGFQKTAVIESSIRIARDLAKTLGVENWAELVKRATIKGTTEGVVAGELLNTVLKLERLSEPKKGGKP